MLDCLQAPSCQNILCIVEICWPLLKLGMRASHKPVRNTRVIVNFMRCIERYFSVPSRESWLDLPFWKVFYLLCEFFQFITIHRFHSWSYLHVNGLEWVDQIILRFFFFFPNDTAPAHKKGVSIWTKTYCCAVCRPPWQVIVRKVPCHVLYCQARGLLVQVGNGWLDLPYLQLKRVCDSIHHKDYFSFYFFNSQFVTTVP